MGSRRRFIISVGPLSHSVIQIRGREREMHHRRTQSRQRHSFDAAHRPINNSADLAYLPERSLPQHLKFSVIVHFFAVTIMAGLYCLRRMKRRPSRSLRVRRGSDSAPVVRLPRMEQCWHRGATQVSAKRSSSGLNFNLGFDVRCPAHSGRGGYAAVAWLARSSLEARDGVCRVEQGGGRLTFTF